MNDKFVTNILENFTLEINSSTMLLLVLAIQYSTVSRIEKTTKKQSDRKEPPQPEELKKHRLNTVINTIGKIANALPKCGSTSIFKAVLVFWKRPGYYSSRETLVHETVAVLSFSWSSAGNILITNDVFIFRCSFFEGDLLLHGTGIVIFGSIRCVASTSVCIAQHCIILSGTVEEAKLTKSVMSASNFLNFIAEQ